MGTGETKLDSGVSFSRFVILLFPTGICFDSRLFFVSLFGMFMLRLFRGVSFVSDDVLGNSLWVY